MKSNISPMSGRHKHVVDVFNSGLLTPPGSHIMDDDTPRRLTQGSPCTPTSQSRPATRALGSPSIRRSSAQVTKRKRNSIVSTSNASSRSSAGELSVSALNDFSTTELHTPNPKPRKQSKRQSNVHTGFASSSDSSLLFAHETTPRIRSLSPRKTSSTCTCGTPSKRILHDSSHAANVKADYIPPGTCPSRKCRMRPRSTTPMYEAPRERFTPPREIEVTPLADSSRISKAAKRGVSAKPKRPSSAYLKREPPEIDLSQALRPPSPTDDPLLLHSTKIFPLRSRATPTFSSSPPGGSSFFDPPKSFAARLSGGRIDDFGGQDDSEILPVFNLPDEGNRTDDWSDSDDEDEFNLTGEYTGKYKMVKVPTKADPPTSATRERMVSWGRPVSPFPYSEIMERSLPSSDLTEEDVLATDAEEVDGRKTLRHEENALPPSDDVVYLTGEPATEPPASDEISSASTEVFEESDVGHPSSGTCRAAQSNEHAEINVRAVEPHSEKDRALYEEEEEEEQVDRALSLALDDGEDDNGCLPCVLDGSEDIQGNGSSDEDEDLENDVVKITSGDASTAARAAAILKLHDYDCILASSVSKKLGRSSRSTRKRRTTIGISGITKPYTDPRVLHRRQTIHGDLISTLTDAAPLLEMCRRAEDSLCLEDLTPGRTSRDAASAFSLRAATPRRMSAPDSGEWGREDWKRLDKCLVAERVSVGAGRSGDLLVDMGGISKEAVLERFRSQMGGEPALRTLGPEWARENLMMRLEVLIRKQQRSSVNSLSFRQGEENNISLDSTIHRGNPRYHSLLEEALAVSSIATPSTAVDASSCDLSWTFEGAEGNVPLPLPCPAPEWVGHSRGLMTTPSRPPDPKTQHPKDQVYLRHASLPKKSRIPVAVRPRRLVDLRHLSPSKLVRKDVVRPQVRVSGEFRVKDLIRCFGGS